MLAIDCLVGGLLVCSVVVNILALGAFWVTPSLRTTANRFVINLLIVNLVCCIILGPSLLLNAFTAHPAHRGPPDVAMSPATIVLDSGGGGPANLSEGGGRCLNGTDGECNTVLLIRSGEPPPSQDDVKFVKSRPGLGGESAAQLTLTKIRCWGLDLVVALGALSVLLVVGDTWCAITDPLRYHSRISELKSWAFILGTWVLGIAFGIASGFRGDQKTVTLFKNRLTAEEVAAIESSHLSRNLTAGPAGMMDHLNISEDLYNTIFSYAYFVIVILLPFGLVCGMYWRIFSEARESGQRMRQNGSSPLLQSALNLAAASAQKQAAAAEKQQILDQQRPDRGEVDGLTLKIDKQIHYEDETITISSIQPVPQYTPPVGGTGSFRHRDSCLKPLLQQSPVPTPTHKLSQEPAEPSGADRAQVVQIATPTSGILSGGCPKDTVLEIPPTPARTPPPLPLAAVHTGGKMRRNQSAGRLVSFREEQPELRPANLRQVHSTPNFQQCGAADFEHIGQHHILSLPAVHVPPKALSYMTSIRHRLSNASSLFKYREESRAARISILVIIMFLVSYLPYGILVLMQGHVDLVIVSDQALLAIFTVVIANLSSPFIFAYRNKRVRRGVKRLLGVDKKTNERLQKLTNSNTHFNNNNNNNNNNSSNINNNGTGPVTGGNVNTTNGNYSANISLASASCGEGLGGPPSLGGGGHKSHKVRIAAGLTRSGSSCKYLTPNHAAAVAVANGYIVEFERYPSDELNSLCIQKKSILKRVCDSSRKWGCNFATNSCTSNDEQTEV